VREGVASVHFELIDAARPLVDRALSFPHMPARSAPASQRRFASRQGQAAESRGRGAGETVAAFHKFFLDGKTFVGGDHPSIADIRLAASLEFLKVIDYHYPRMGEEPHGCGRQGEATPMRPGAGRRRLHRLCQGQKK
jgi:glutathione S-transferase